MEKNCKTCGGTGWVMRPSIPMACPKGCEQKYEPADISPDLCCGITDSVVSQGEKREMWEDGLQKLMDDINEWSNATFLQKGHNPSDRNPAIIHHLKKEVDELIESINRCRELGEDESVGVGEFGRQVEKTKLEYADCLTLLIDSAKCFGMTAYDLVTVCRVKLEINKSRKWGSPDRNGVIEHII